VTLKKGIIQILKFLAFLSLGLVLLWLAFRDIDFKNLSKGLKEANYFWLIPALAFATLAYLSRARRWNLLIHPLGYKPSFKNSFYAMMTGYLANIALPRIGEITKCVALGKKEKIPVDQLIGTVVIERTIDFFSLLVILIIMLIVDGSTLGPFLVDNIYIPFQQKISQTFGATWVFWLILTFAGLAFLLTLYLLRAKLYRIRFFAKIFETLKGIVHGLKTITRIEHKWEFIFHTVFIWVNYALMTWVVVFAVKSLSHLDFADGIFLLVIGGLAMSAPVNSGLGAFHFIVSGGLMAVYGVTKEDGLVYAILSHESQLIYGAVLGVISFYALVKKSPSAKAGTADDSIRIFDPVGPDLKSDEKI
jgi:glycosyltransferase 2 family protein